MIYIAQVKQVLVGDTFEVGAEIDGDQYPVGLIRARSNRGLITPKPDAPPAPPETPAPAMKRKLVKKAAKKR